MEASLQSKGVPNYQEAAKVQAGINKAFYVIRGITSIFLLIAGVIGCIFGLCAKNRDEAEAEEEEEKAMEQAYDEAVENGEVEYVQE